MSERKPLTLEELREVPHGKIKDETLRHICDRANDIASKPIRLDRSAWEPCDFCGKELDEYPYIVAHSDYDESNTCYTPAFCPMCGRPLTDAAWDMLERRLAGCEHQ